MLLQVNDADGGSTVITMEDEGFFGRLFSPGTVDTDVSGDDDSVSDGSSDDSATIFTDEKMSASESESGMSSDGEEASTSSSMIRFDRELRAKHRSACKNMTVCVDSLSLQAYIPFSNRILLIVLIMIPHFLSSCNNVDNIIIKTSFFKYIDREICKSN